MRILLLFVLSLSLIGGMTAAQESQHPITVVDATGREVTIESVEAIVSGSGDVTEIIDALGFYDNLVGVDATSTYPEKALDEKSLIGFSRRLTVEPIVALQPTLFFCTEICGPPEVFEQLRALGIPVVIVPDREDGGLELPFPKIALVSEVLGVPERGAALAETVQREIQWSQIAIANVQNTPTVLNFYVRGRGLQLAFGDNTPTDAVIEGAGGINAAARAGVNGYQALTPEIILTAFPDYLLLMEGSVDSSGGLDAVLEIQGVRATPAVQNGNIIIMDTEYLLGMSIRTGRAVLDLASQLHDDMTWELEIPYPYTVIDATDTEIVVSAAESVVVTTEPLLQLTRQLGFHSEAIGEPREGSLILATLNDDWESLRAAGYTVLVVADETDVMTVAAALDVPGRGEALLAYQQQ